MQGAMSLLALLVVFLLQDVVIDHLASTRFCYCINDDDQLQNRKVFRAERRQWFLWKQ